ncbi:MAG: hypothetical protein ACYDC1_25765, partial [Limisphaerales bacterium]
MIPPPPLDLTRLKVLPLEQRRSLTTLDEVLIEPADDPPPVDDPLKARIEECAARIRSAQARGAGVLLI